MIRALPRSATKSAFRRHRQLEGFSFPAGLGGAEESTGACDLYEVFE